jgi:MarR family transcriptional regulator, organic hydroperoxide resistance regulator
MPASPSPKSKLAAEVWRRIFDFIVATSPRRIELLALHGLTPNESRALQTPGLEGEGRTMRSLAAEWRCDASTATWTVDRLEAKGLAERRSHASDRRVKLVALTAHGVAIKAALIAGIYAPPPELLELTDQALAELERAVSALPTIGGVDPGS